MREEFLVLLLLLAACGGACGSTPDASADQSTKYPEGCILGLDADGRTPTCTMDRFPPCPDTGPPEFNPGSYPCLGGNIGGQGMFWEGCDKEVPKRLNEVVERRDEVMQDHDASDPEAEEAARRVAEVVTSLSVLGCDREVEAALDSQASPPAKA